jgi:hypothetical protein
MEIMFDDLIPEAQEKLLKEAGISTPEEMGWDENPIAFVDLEEENELEDQYEEEDLYDYDLDYDDEEDM